MGPADESPFVWRFRSKACQRVYSYLPDQVCTSAPQPVQLNKPGGRPWFLSCVASKLSPHFGQMKTTVVCTPLTIAPSCAPTHPAANTRLDSSRPAARWGGALSLAPGHLAN